MAAVTPATDTTPSDLDATLRRLAADAHAAALKLAVLPTTRKDAALLRLADLLVARTDELLNANAEDLAQAARDGLAPAMQDRLRFSAERIAKMADGVREVAALPDPVGEELERATRPNGLDLRRVRVPIGVVGIIYESRPNVTVDCAVLCLKSGNASILRGGREAWHTNNALVRCIHEALTAEGLDPAAVSFVPTTDRAALNLLLTLDDHIHCLIPRGGEGLIRFVAEHARMPVIKHYTGVCSVYLDTEADPDLAESITVNAKVQRPSVCNAIENLFVHAAAAPALLSRVGKALVAAGVTLRAEENAAAILQEAGVPYEPATEDDFFAEYLDLRLAVKVVASVDEAIAAANRYGSHHSDAIVTTNAETAEHYLAGVDSAAVFWNASTRFNDGFEFGLGAEIGISTDKLHARGPMGLRELTTYKWIARGTGQIKG